MKLMSHDFLILLPEISLSILALLVQMIGVSKRMSSDIACRLALAGLCIVIYSIYKMQATLYGEIFAGSYVQNDYTICCKLIVLIAAALVIANYIGYHKSIFQQLQSEYVVLILLSCAGAGVAISARDFIVLFVGFELQSLTAYVLASFSRNSPFAAEAGLKYFVLGALSSCVMLFGISFLYGFSGSTSYFVVSNILSMNEVNIGLIIGALFFISGLMFKLSIVPFHMWTPDVYEGAPLMSVSLFASMQKISSLAVVITIFALCLKPLGEKFHYFMKIAAILSIMVGSIAAVMQTSVKRIMAYSTILNMGYVLIPLCFWSAIGFEVAMQYLVIYTAASIALFALLSAALGDKAEVAKLDDLSALGRTKKAAAAAITIIMISLIGLPPFAGFFAKYYILTYAIKNEQYLLVAMLLAGSVIAAYYYLNIIKVMYFSELKVSPSSSKLNLLILVPIIITLGYTIFYSVLPSVPLILFMPTS